MQPDPLVERFVARPWMVRAVPLLAAGSVLLLAALPAKAQGTAILVDNACDKLVIDQAPEAPDPNLIVAAPGAVIQLTADSICTPVVEFVGGPDLNGDGVVGVLNPRTGEVDSGLVAGNGITVEAAGVVVDLNGFDITSANVDLDGDGVFADVATEADAFGVDVENGGVAVGAANVQVVNSSTNVSVVDNFTANFDYKLRNFDPDTGEVVSPGGSSLQGTLVDHDLDAATPMVANISAGPSAHGGGAIAIDDSSGLSFDTLTLVDLAGDNGIDLKFSNDISITNSTIVGILSGIRVRSTTNVTLTGNTISSCGVAVDEKTSTFTATPLDAVNTLTDGAIAGSSCPLPPD